MISALSFFEPFQSPASGEWITSRTQHREDLKKTGHILWEPGLSQDIARRREEIKAKDFEKVEKAVDTYVAAAVSAGKLET